MLLRRVLLPLGMSPLSALGWMTLARRQPASSTDWFLGCGAGLLVNDGQSTGGGPS